MRLSVAQLLKEPIGSTRVYTLEEGLGERVVGRLDLTRTDRGVWVRGKLETSVLSGCSRCLCEFNQALTLLMNDQYYPLFDILSGDAIPAADLEDDAYRIDAHHVLDLGEAVRQSTLVSLPMKPLCQQDCYGICSQCGVNRNETLCQCVERFIDQRWNPLLELLSQKAISSE